MIVFDSFDLNDAPRVSFTKQASWNTEVLSYVELFTEKALWNDLNKAVEEEDYERAVVYRNELIRRGKLVYEN